MFLLCFQSESVRHVESLWIEYLVFMGMCQGPSAITRTSFPRRRESKRPSNCTDDRRLRPHQVASVPFKYSHRISGNLLGFPPAREGWEGDVWAWSEKCCRISKYKLVQRDGVFTLSPFSCISGLENERCERGEYPALRKDARVFQSFFVKN